MSQTVHIGPLGDLSAFSAIVSDTLKLVQSGKNAAAVTCIKAYEVLWDKQASALQAKSEAKWTAIDGPPTWPWARCARARPPEPRVQRRSRPCSNF